MIQEAKRDQASEQGRLVYCESVRRVDEMTAWRDAYRLAFKAAIDVDGLVARARLAASAANAAVCIREQVFDQSKAENSQ